MSCSELGLTDCGLRVSKSSDMPILATFQPATLDLAGFDSEFAVKASLSDASPELTVGTSATANGSVIVISENTILLTLKRADLQTLPNNAEDAAEPWVGWFEWTTTDTAGLVTRFLQQPIIVERGAAE